MLWVVAGGAGALGQQSSERELSLLPASCRVGGPGQITLCLSQSQVARSPLKEFDKEKAWRAVMVQMAQ